MFRFRGVVLALSVFLAPITARAQSFPPLETYPRVNGSTSTALLGQLLAARALNLDVQLRRLPSSRYGALGGVQLTLPLGVGRQEAARYRPSPCVTLTKAPMKPTSHSYGARAT
jgi:hypothetical protein